MKSHTLLIICCLFSINNFAQSGGIRIEGITMVVASGNPKIVIENGDFYSDAAFFDVGQSEILFTGDASFDETTIGGTSFLNFYNLTINKSVEGIKLKNHIYVNNDLKFVDGLIDLNGNNAYLPNDGKLLNESEHSRVMETDGGLISKTGELNTPFQKNLGNLGAIITSDKNLGITTITRGHEPQSGAGNTGIERYFDINPTNNENLNATLRLHYFDAELNGIDESELTLYRNSGSGWEDMGMDENDKDDDWVEIYGVEHFSAWTMASFLNPLPIEWLNFTARLNEFETVDLNWETALEINNDHFIIEKSLNGIDFFEIGKVNSKGNSTEIQHYYFEDKNPLYGNNYYRIQQIDLSGDRGYSEIRLVNFEASDLEVAVFPNPSNGHFQVSFSLENAAEIEIRLTDILGRHLKILQNTTLLQDGLHFQNFDLTTFPAGIYFLDFQVGKKLIRKKIIFH